ncbi:Fis family transcriptional regulator [Brevibacillus fluminis]|uniref:HTH-type transcriptional regulatory protein TyrR n=1 Tax=Brevibacillus fluminis TaxID=511487 RepID=A0A3M8D7G5_9BACL|nr:sigma 54-interacting transcriptional regulator [Brevibacillus fluminis]RNB83337.1 Fis family transcriptional regulator [Brevibacillus fluminis]
MKAEDYFIREAVCLEWPITFEQLVQEAVRSVCKWFVLRQGSDIRGCIRRDAIADRFARYGLASFGQPDWENMMTEAIVVNGAAEDKSIYQANKVVILTGEQHAVKGVIDWEIDDAIHGLVAQDSWLIKELQTVFYEFYNNVFVTDEKGTVIRVTAADDQQHLGKNVFDLERDRAFYPSVTAKVLKSGKREKSLQYTQTGDVFMIESIPIKNNDGEIVRVVSVTKDTSEINQLTTQLDELRNLLDNYQREVVRFQQEKLESKPFVYKSKQMQNLYELVKSVASVDTSVLILGETGVGKQMVANQIHMLSNRRDHPFITVNCGAIPENLLESELFGYEEGAFSGARKGGKLGIFEMADKGTVFLDEIGEMPLHLQVKLLRVLQERTIMKVGGTKEKKVDVRILTATNQNLEEMVQKQTFRQDLYYRINIIPIQIPPLRERKEDIHALAFTFLHQYNQKYRKNAEISETQLDQLLKYSWPGNVRELENKMERYAVTGQLILGNGGNQTDERAFSDQEGPLPSLLEHLDEVELRILRQAMARYKTTREIAAHLGVNQSTIVRKMRKHNL